MKSVIILGTVLVLLLANMFTPASNFLATEKADRTAETEPSKGSLSVLQEREKIEQTQKVEVTIEIVRIHLLYAGDSAEGDPLLGIAWRGYDGEIMLSSWVSWMPGEITHKDPGEENKRPQLDGNDPQIIVLGPINDFPNGGTQGFAGGGLVYHQKADCPVNRAVNVCWTLWDDDSGSTARDIMNAILKGIIDAAQAKGMIPAGFGAGAAKAVVEQIINGILSDGETPLGVYSALIDIDDPCEAEKGAVLDETRRVDITNTAPSSAFKGWYPEFNGWLEYKIKVRHLDERSSNMSIITPQLPDFHKLVVVDIGQPDETTLSGTLQVASPIPFQPLTIDYRFLLDTDDNLSTGATSFPEKGAEFDLRLVFANSESPVGKLLKWNDLSASFEEVAGGIYDFALDTSHQYFSLFVELQKLDNPTGPITAWAVAQNGSLVLDVLPDSPETMPVPCITPNYGFSYSEPYVLFVTPRPNQLDASCNATVEVKFSKSMNRTAAQSAFSISPSILGSFSWHGTSLIFEPQTFLEPLTKYYITIDEEATDCVGTTLDGDGDGLPGGVFMSTFWTEGLPLFASNVSGNEKRLFSKEEPIYVFGKSFPLHTELRVYMIQHPQLQALINGSMPLVDVRESGFSNLSSDEYGTINPTQLCSEAPFPGEFNLVVDIDENGLFDMAQDRIDRLSIGFSIRAFHNVAVKDVAFSRTVLGQGYSGTINVTVGNLGTFTETFNVITAHDGLYVPSINQTEDFGDMGDVNRDGYIDDVDIYLLTLAFGSTPDDSNWNPNCDLHPDEIINALDSQVLASNFGKDIWTYFGLSPGPINKTTITLTSGNLTTFSLEWDTESVDKNNYSITIVAWPVLYESYTGDNTLLAVEKVCVTIPGDVNGDFDVDLYDAVGLLVHYGAKADQPEYDPICDIDGDGDIDLYDAVILLTHYGQKYP